MSYKKTQTQECTHNDGNTCVNMQSNHYGDCCEYCEYHETE